jgi:hypothetical protein
MWGGDALCCASPSFPVALPASPLLGDASVPTLPPSHPRPYGPKPPPRRHQTIPTLEGGDVGRVDARVALVAWPSRLVPSPWATRASTLFLPATPAPTRRLRFPPVAIFLTLPTQSTNPNPLYKRWSASFISHIRMLPSSSMFQHQRMNVWVLGSVKINNMLRKLGSPLVSGNYILTGFRQSQKLR